jgi:pyruvate/2-oxoglutarate dehydrogenase complex dihydrolipoamide dehydrogenase (E3) component
MFGIPTAYLITIAVAASFVAGGAAAWKYQGARLETCEANSAHKDVLIDEQNRAVRALKGAGDIVRQAAQTAQEQASAAEARAAQAEAPRKAAIAAGTGPATCFGAIGAASVGLKP